MATSYAFQPTYGSAQMGNSGGSPTGTRSGSTSVMGGSYQPFNGAAQTFAQLQNQGYARPPMPQTMNPAQLQDAMRASQGLINTTRSIQPNTFPTSLQRPPVNIQRPPSYNPGGGAGVEYASPFSGGLTNALKGGMGGGNQGPMAGGLQNALMALLQNPSRYDQNAATKTFDMLNSRLSDQFTNARSGLEAEMARRGLLSSTVYGSKLGDLGGQQARAQSDLATSIATDQAKGYTGDLMAAIQGALGYNQQQLGQQNQGIRNAMDYESQQFGQQLGTAQFNNQQDEQFFNQLMQMLGVTG